MSCDLHVFVYEATEPISSQWAGWSRRSVGECGLRAGADPEIGAAMRVVTSTKVRGAAVLSIGLLLSPCRSVVGLPGEPSSFGECFGTLSWHIHDGRADGIDLSGLRPVMSLRFIDRVQPAPPGHVRDHGSPIGNADRRSSQTQADFWNPTPVAGDEVGVPAEQRPGETSRSPRRCVGSSRLSALRAAH
jgi:hypothetical protein